jgi:hypothetical protein
MRNRQGVSIAIASLAIIGAGIAIFVQARDGGPRGPGDRYFSVDDGETFFADDGRKLAPFDKDGKPAYRAHVFECGGKRVVGFLSRHTPEALKAFEIAKAARGTGKPPPNVHELASIGMTGIEVKRRGPANQWVRQGDAARATEIRAFRCPDGSTPEEVFP